MSVGAVKQLRSYMHNLRRSRCKSGTVAQNFYMIDGYARECERTLSASARVRDAALEGLYLFLSEGSFTTDAEGVKTAAAELSLTDGELSVLHAMLIYCCIKRISLSRDTDCAQPISLLRKCALFDYVQIYESCSVTEKILLTSCLFRESDEETRARYRREIYSYAKKTRTDARECARLFASGKLQGFSLQKKHVCAKRLYFPLLFAVTALLLVCEGAAMGITSSPYAFYLLPLSVFPLWEAARYLIDYSYSKLLPASPPPRLGREEIPPCDRTLVVITSLLCGHDEALFSRLEDYYLSNRTGDVVFGILGDLCDSEGITHPDDEETLRRAQGSIDRLRVRHGCPFYLFTRSREYSITQRRFIAPERKRGAVCELARLLFTSESALEVYGGEAPRGVRYVITLDADTALPPGAVLRMVNCASHPENVPVTDEKTKRVVAGHGVLQPVVRSALSSGTSSLFSLLVSGRGGVQLYESCCFDIYGETFGEGIFCGKGIFEVESFYKCAVDVFPDEKILSHDIIEGCRLRAGTMNDVVLYDSVPKNALSYYKRQNRWIRGDIQSLPFCGEYVRGADGKRKKTDYTALDRFKLFDNARRGLSPLCAAAVILLSLLHDASVACGALLFMLFYAVFPVVVSGAEELMRGFAGLRRRFYSLAVTSLVSSVLMCLWKISVLLHEGKTALAAFMQSLYRMCVSKRNMLLWVSAGAADKRLKNKLSAYLLSCPVSVLIGAALFLFVPYPLYRLFGLLSLLSPFIMYGASKPLKQGGGQKDEKDKKQLIAWSRDAWAYFENFVSAETNHLPPDNYSELGTRGVAARTSPTNIGLYMLSCLCACDFGFITPAQLNKRLSDTLDTVAVLKKYKGNLYNWYDTSTCGAISPFISLVDSGNFVVSLVTLKQGLDKYISLCTELCRTVKRIDSVIKETDLLCMYDKKHQLFYIGCTADGEVTENNRYDIYMSEARTTDFYAAACGLVPPSHLGRLGRVLISEAGHIGLASWAGTAFEYFMPALFLPVVRNSLSYEALSFAYSRQRAHFVKCRGVQLYGTSESCYFAFDGEMNYQYKAHGVPTLGLKYGLSEDFVISPYSSFLMLCMGRAPIDNLKNLIKLGAYGRFGFYEAVDFTRSRVGGGYAVIRSYMAHHIGMSLIAADNFVYGDINVRRFTSDEYVKSALLLLDEAVPADDIPRPQDILQPELRESPRSLSSPAATSSCSVISNTRDRITVTGDGVSLARAQVSITPEAGEGSIFSFSVLSLCCGEVVSVLSDTPFTSPCRRECKCSAFGADYLCILPTEQITEASVTVAADESLFCTEITAPEGAQTAICFTPVLCRAQSYLSHISYARLFIFARIEDNILYYRRSRGGGEEELFLALCLLDADGGRCAFDCEMSADAIFPYAFDRDDIKRAMEKSHISSGSNTGREITCINPVVFVKTPLSAFAVLISTGKSRDEARDILLRAQGKRAIGSENKKALRQLYETVLRVGENGEVISALLSHTPSQSSAKTAGTFTKKTLWSHGISGDRPILTLDLRDGECTPESCALIEKYISAHKASLIYGIPYDTVILYESNDSYYNKTRDFLLEEIRKQGAQPLLSVKNGVFVINCTDSGEVRFFYDMSFLVCASGVEKKTGAKRLPEVRALARPCRSRSFTPPAVPAGGCVTENKDVYIKKGGQSAPWSYIYANESFGTLITQNSLGFTWYENSKQNKLTSWDADALYERGEEVILSCGGLEYDLARCAADVVYSSCEGAYFGGADGVDFEMRVCCDGELALKAVYITLKNTTEETLTTELAYRARFVMGERENGVSCLRGGSGAANCLTVRNMYSRQMSCTAFLYSPAGRSPSFDGRVGVLHSRQRISPHTSICISFIMGVANSADALKVLTGKTVNEIYASYEADCARYLSVFHLKTDNPALDVMFNKFAPYQALYCRIYARCGFYQTGGAYGFRDQLQDSLWTLYSAPHITRAQILRCAEHQYEEGDVMHWYHPGEEVMGVRTRCSDDMLWLVYTVCEYVRVTKDTDILNVQVGYLSSPPLKSEENDRYEKAVRGDLRESLYMHCVRAVEYGMKFGEHGLALFGSGDWNDGMNEVGVGGRGESVWLSRFLCGVLIKMATLAASVHDVDGAEKYRQADKRLDEAIEKFAYNGRYYVRGTRDDGGVLGAAEGDGCRIDILPQAFSSIFGSDTERNTSALNEAWAELYDGERKLMKLLTPPFTASSPRAGYINDYPPGVRENGGQYTHGAIWGAIGYFVSGQPERGYELLCAVNPLDRLGDAEAKKHYRGEPYVFAGDVYANPDHPGRCGWSWYTGAAGWFCTAVLRYLLGYEESGDGFTLKPSFCDKFTAFTLTVSKNGVTHKVTASKNSPPEGKYPFPPGKGHSPTDA